MRLQLVCCKHELLFRLLPFRVVLIGIERVNHQRTIHLNRVLLITRIKEEASSKTTHGRRTFLVQHRIRPETDDAMRHLKFWFVFLPRHFHFEVRRFEAERGTSDQTKNQKQSRPAEESR
jgi:hypothetical protein